MIESTDEIYENIADNLRKGIAEPWDQATLTIRLEGNDVSFEGCYVHGDTEGSIRVSAFSRTLNDDLQKLHTLTVKDTHNEAENWCEAVFTLYKDGHYEIRFLPKAD